MNKMRIRLFVGLLSLLFVGSFWSCDDDCTRGRGGQRSREFLTEEFTSVLSSGSFEIEITEGTVHRVEAIGDESILEVLIVEVNSTGELDVRLPDGCFRNFSLRVAIQTPDIDRVSVSGSGNVLFGAFEELDDLIVETSGSGGVLSIGSFTITDRAELSSSGSGSIGFSLSTSDLSVEITGSGGIGLEGEADSQTVSLSSSGNYMAFDLTSQSCTVTCSGSGSAEVTVEQDLDYEISGSGNISYRGDPSISGISTGSGTLIDAN